MGGPAPAVLERAPRLLVVGDRVVRARELASRWSGPVAWCADATSLEGALAAADAVIAATGPRAASTVVAECVTRAVPVLLLVPPARALAQGACVVLDGRVALPDAWAGESVARASLVVRGEPGSDLDDRARLWSALTLAHRLAGDGARLVEPRASGGEVAFVLRGGASCARLDVRVAPASVLDVELVADGQRHMLSFEQGGAAVQALTNLSLEMLAGRRLHGAREAAPAADDLAELAAVLEEARLPSRGDFDEARRFASDDVWRAIGLRLDPDAPRGAFAVEGDDADPLQGLSTEHAAFRAGLKPVVFLTVRPRDLARNRAELGPDVYVVTHERGLSRDRHTDRWDERTSTGEQFVELFAGRDRAAVEEAATLQRVDASKHTTALGALMGYPPCCVARFAARSRRDDNSANRYATFAATPPDAARPWPWELQDFAHRLVPFHPCSYVCPAALAWARGVLDEFERARPGAGTKMQRVLARDVLYFADSWRIALDRDPASGLVRASIDGRVDQRIAPLARALAGARTVELARDVLVVVGADGRVSKHRRVDPGLGLLAPFGGGVAP